MSAWWTYSDYDGIEVQFMKHNFPKPGEWLVCEVCGDQIHTSTDPKEVSEDGDEPGWWCEKCRDYRGGRYKTCALESTN